MKYHAWCSERGLSRRFEAADDDAAARAVRNWLRSRFPGPGRGQVTVTLAREGQFGDLGEVSLF